jgi:hypothetical protein
MAEHIARVWQKVQQAPNPPLDAQHLLEGVFISVPHFKLIPGVPEGPAVQTVSAGG